MAKDYLSAPASSVPSEQIFSLAGDIITKKRNKLLEGSCSSLLLLKSWLKDPELEDWELSMCEAGEIGDEEEEIEPSGPACP